MDIFFRLRFLFWAMVLGLSGLLVKQFYFDDFSSEIPQLQRVHSPFLNRPSSAAAAFPNKDDFGAAREQQALEESLGSPPVQRAAPEQSIADARTARPAATESPKPTT